MTPRFQRGKTGAISAFFAFQDVIVSAMAALISVIMLVALSMGGVGSRKFEEPDTPAMATRLKSVLDRLGATREEIRTAREAISEEQADPALIRGQIQILSRELAAVRGDAKSREEKAQDIREKDVTREIRGELNSKRLKNAKAATELKKIEGEAAIGLREMDSLEASVKIQEAALLAEQTRTNQLWVVPDPSASSKEAVLVVVSGNQATLQRFDNPEKQTLDGAKATEGFTKALKSYSSSKQYIVFYFKPSGADQFKQLTQEARDAGFEIGYDAINEDVTVNFSSPK